MSIIKGEETEEPMDIAIISDTHINHINKDVNKLEKLMQTYFKDVAMVIHAGDFTNEAVIDYLERQKKFVGVWGNIDDERIRKILKEKEIIELKGYRIGVFHGHGNKKTTIDRAYEAFKEDKVDIIIFGHSHQPIIKTMKGILMINPGSPTNKRRERWFSAIILKLDKNKIDIELKLYEKL